MSYYQNDLDPNKKKEKVTAPLIISHFNANMAMMMMNVCFLLLFIYNISSIPEWLITILHCSFWLIWACGIILILGYFVAILDHNVHVVTQKQQDKSDKK